MATSTDLLLSQHFLLALVLFFAVYWLSIAFYRLYLSPLAKFPGPKLAALTYWVEFYYDVIKRGQYTFELVRLHEQYGKYGLGVDGPIVRITPHELHINDPDYWDAVYPGSQKPTDKYPPFTEMFGIPGSVLATVPHDLHRMRRSVLNPFFSKRTVVEHSGIIESAVEKLCVRLEEFRKSQDPLDLRFAFSALTADVISMYSYCKSYDCLSKPDFDAELSENIASGGETGLLLKHYPWIFKFANMLPFGVVKRLNPKLIAMVNRKIEIEQQVREIMSDNDPSVSHFSQEKPKSPSIFHKLINSDMPSEEKSLFRLVDEGYVLIGAGTVTTAHTLSTITYHVLANPPILQTLRAELHSTTSDNDDRSSPPTPRLTRLERLPYLTAIIKEGLRLAHAIPHRNPRVRQDHPLQYREWTIPPGTPVSMTSYLLHIDPVLFPEPYEFRPERWLAGSKELQSATTMGESTNTHAHNLDKYLLPFGRGSRICLGQNLAYAELYLGLAAVFGRFEMRLFETERKKDVDVAHDFIAGSPRVDSKGMRVVVC